MQELLRKTLEANRDQYISCLLELVRRDTHTIGHGIEGGLEANGQEYLMELFTAFGAQKVVKDPLDEATIEQCKHLYHEGNLGHHYDNRYNVYATFAGGGGRSILFNGHMDHMPPDNPANWTSPPYEPEVRDGRIYGSGICDMKSGLMASVMALKLLKDANIALPGDVTIASVCDEEGGGNGSLVAAMHGVKADAVVVCEPTNYELIAAHMGWVFFQVEFTGVAVHSGLKRAGVNAIEKAVKVMEAIDQLEHRWLLTYKHPLLPPPSSNVGVITGGEAGSTIPDYCCFKTCVHYLPRLMSHEQVVKEYTDAIDLCCAGDAWLREHKPRITIYQTGNPFEMELDHPFVNCFKDAYLAALGREARIVGSPAGCDSRTWHNIALCPTLQYGPGSLAQCHTVDEYVTTEAYLDAILVYANLILNWSK